MKSKKIILECGQCGAHNYRTHVAVDHKERLILKKYCPRCQQHTWHYETR
ncbi:50S ribosomal protein L33 [Bombilactobacillus mellis]|nr:50S ribosomal protein L33 [Bombilactobacillus mellis]MBI0106715.1 50S ribosomal protein L33 [Lactobacillus sp. W8086]MBI0108179.1 50S ribosomal protein L33 [Lactobacillus sp. W8085]MBI0111397.1 50S ribosomal protein L33 [Lactobacillus sp. W8088]MBI0115112.1 50S ribosomal protein L33 [Lactobacillus sp. W8087]MBI0118837.1 50S ribosomal protein L33 [Lactobacillus sp. W8089]MBI0130802.1 50S ribosomal protein L33 [Lactobacillus sp. W8090]